MNQAQEPCQVSARDVGANAEVRGLGDGNVAHFVYVRPGATKTGEISLPLLGTFDNVNEESLSLLVYHTLKFKKIER